MCALDVYFAEENKKQLYQMRALQTAQNFRVAYLERRWRFKCLNAICCLDIPNLQQNK
jgi:hypothetical protein